MAYLPIENTDFGFFNAVGMADKGRDLHDAYVNADPFPHTMIDDFCSPEILDLCLDQFPTKPDPGSRSFDRDQERYKTSFNPDYMPDRLRSFFYSLNSRPFLAFLENLTGIHGLIPDPFFLGGGFHQTRQGGHLSVHADFNHHEKLDLERRLNILIYLNRDWRESYGGALELWDADMKRCVQRITPEFNRCVVFSTSGKSFHGHPAPVNHPDEIPRRSIALYYYTATWDKSSAQRTTQFRRRPGSEDAEDWTIRLGQITEDITPPLLMRGFHRLGRAFRK